MSNRCWFQRSSLATSSSSTISEVTKAKLTRRANHSAGAKLFFLPPYRPDLNPIEQASAKLTVMRFSVHTKVGQRLVEQFSGRMVLWLIIQLSVHPLQPSLQLLINKYQCSKCVMHVTVTSRDDLINRQLILIKEVAA